MNLRIIQFIKIVNMRIERPWLRKMDINFARGMLGVYIRNRYQYEELVDALVNAPLKLRIP